MGKMTVGLISGFAGFYMTMCTCDLAITDHVTKDYTNKIKENVRDSFQLSATEYEKMESKLDATIKNGNGSTKSIKNAIEWQKALDSLKWRQVYQDSLKITTKRLKKVRI